MATVSDNLRGGGDRDRAQLLLVGALSLAIALVAVALVLNSAIYTHNLASRQDNPGDDVVTFNRDVRVSAGETLDYANRGVGNVGYGAVGNTYTGGLASVEDTVNDRASVDVAATRVSHVGNSQVRGVRVVDADGGSFEARAMLDLMAPEDWTVARDVRVRSFVMALEDPSVGLLASLGLTEVQDFLDDLAGGSDVFTVEFVGDTDTYRVAVYDDSGPTVTVHRVGTSVYRTCSAPDSDATLDFTAGRFGGQSCDALSFVDDLSDTYTVRYYNSDLVSGSYELYADLPVEGAGDEAGTFTDLVDAANDGDNGYHCGATTYYPSGSSEYPRVVPAYYATDLNIRYDAPDVTFVGTQRVAGGEAGPAPVSPRIESMTVSDSTDGDGDAEFDVDASVTDPDGNLASVTVTVVDQDGDVAADDTTTVSGSSASVSPFLQDDENDGPYSVQVTVTDTDGNTRSVEQAHDATDDTGCPS